MDVLRVCKTHRVYWDNAKTRSSLIVWYRVSDETPFFPGPHVFSSETYDTCHWWNPGAGEDDQSPPAWYDGADPVGFTPTVPCGSLDWFANGAPSDAPAIPRDVDGFPACCGAPTTSEPPFPPSKAPPVGPCGPFEIVPAAWQFAFDDTWASLPGECHCDLFKGFKTTTILFSSPPCMWSTLGLFNGLICGVTSGAAVYLVIDAVNATLTFDINDSVLGHRQAIQRVPVNLFLPFGTNVFDNLVWNGNPFCTAGSITVRPA